MFFKLEKRGSNKTHDCLGLKMSMCTRLGLLNQQNVPQDTPVVLVVGNKRYEKFYYQFRTDAGSLVASWENKEDQSLQYGRLTLADLQMNGVYDIRKNVQLREDKYDYAISFDGADPVICLHYLD